MTRNPVKSPDGWSLNEGLAAQYAAQAGLDPDLAAPAGEAAWDVLKSLRDAVDERDPARRAKRVQRTQQRLAKAGLGRHRELVHAIQERLATLSGSDNAKPSINPETGLQQFSVECADEGGCRQDPVGPIEEITVYGNADGGSSFQPGFPITGPSVAGGTGNVPLDPPGLWSNDGLPEEISVVPNPDAETSPQDYALQVESLDVIKNWTDEKIESEIEKVDEELPKHYEAIGYTKDQTVTHIGNRIGRTGLTRGGDWGTKFLAGMSGGQMMRLHAYRDNLVGVLNARDAARQGGP